MTDITLQVAETVEALKDSVLKNIEISKNEMSEQSKNTREAFTTVTTEYKFSIEAMQSNMQSLLTVQNDNIKQSSDLMDKIKITLGENGRINQQFESMIEKSRGVAQLIENISGKFENNSSLLSETSSSLKESITSFNDSIGNYINRNNELLNNQSVSLEKTKEVAVFYSERFATIETGLKGIFDQIQIGLKDYQTTTAENLNKYLSEFSIVLNEAHQGLEKNVSGLNEITDELNDQIEKLIARKDD
jgi:ABC-type transporter Mla subunit MlaD